MSTMNLTGDISFEKDSRRLSLVSSQGNLNRLIEEALEIKSESEAEKESEARQKKIDYFVTHAQKVRLSSSWKFWAHTGRSSVFVGQYQLYSSENYTALFGILNK